ncbi:paired amphipathic helix protein Sin3-like 6 [Carex rostrata]
MRGHIPKREPITFQDSLRFVKKVKSRDYMLYLSLFDILSRKEQIPLETYQELFMLFRNHEDLREELERFRPKCPQRGLYSHNSFWMSIFLLPLVFVSVLLAFDKPFSYLQQVAN